MSKSNLDECNWYAKASKELMEKADGLLADHAIVCVTMAQACATLASTYATLHLADMQAQSE